MSERDVLSVFQSAIRGTDGEVDSGYLAMYATGAATVGMIPVIVFAGVTLAFLHPERAGEILQQTGIGAGAVSGAFATVIGAVGLFRAGDKERAPQMPAGASQSIVVMPQGAGAQS